MDIFGGLIDAAGGLLGSIFGNKSEEEQQDKNLEFSWYTNTHNMLDRISGGKYGDYMKEVAFRTPEEQAAAARRGMETMFPELNPWELAGTNAAGVASSMGSDANATATKSAAASSQQMTAAMQANTQLETAKMNNQAQLLGKVIDAGVSMANNEATNQTSRDNTTATMAPQMELLEQNKAKLTSDIAQTISNTNLTDQKFQTEVLNTVNTHLQSAGIKLNAQQISLVNQRIAKEIKLMDTSKSEVGKLASDATNIVLGAVSEVTSAASSVASSAAPAINSGKEMLGKLWTDLTSPSNQPPTRDPNPKRKRTYGGSVADTNKYPTTM